jgi:long-chain acyl-CoA synthetase
MTPAPRACAALPDRSRIGRVALGDLLQRAARRFPARTALIEGEQALSFAQLDAASNRMAHALRAQGLQPGDRVAMLCENSIPMVIAMFGVYKAGLVWVPVNTALAADAIGYILDHAQASHLVIDSALLARDGLRELGARFGPNLTCCDAPDDALPSHGASLGQRLAGQPETLPEIAIDGADLVQIMYTSGTTGKQKGVMHSHASIHSVLLSNLVEWGVGLSDEVFSCHLPLFHVGQHVVLLSALLGGAASVLMKGFHAGQLLAAIPRHRITLMVGLPMMYRELLDHPQRGANDLSSLRFCIYAMAPMSKPLLLRLLAELCPRFALCSGQTEMYTAATIFRPEQQLKRFGAYWGVATLVNEMAVMDDEGKLLGVGEVGEIVWRGPNLMLGYYRDPEATAHAWRFGWHHSGDLGRWDEDDELLFLDRIKDMIKTGGENVPSIKVEEVLLRHPSVRNAAVVGLPHERWGEAITAFLVTDPDRPVSNEQIAAHCREHLGAFEVPKAFVQLPALPVTSTGKVQKFALRQDHLAYFGDPT